MASKPLVKVLCLVDGDKPKMGYFYEAMDRDKEQGKPTIAKNMEEQEKQHCIS